MSQIEMRSISAEETLDLRHRVMWPDLPREAVRVPGDDTALHFGAFSDGALLGVGSFFADGPRYRLRKLAVDRQAQERGIATQLLAFAMDNLRGLGAKEIWCDARVSATGFYERNGFALEETVFQKQGLDYVIARKRL